MADLESSRGQAPSVPGAVLRRFPSEVLKADQEIPVVLEFMQPPVAIYLRENPGADAEAYREALRSKHSEFLEYLKSTGVQARVAVCSVVEEGPEGIRVVQVPHDFTHVFNGMGVLVPGTAVERISLMPGVRAITHNQERVYLTLDKSVPFTGAPRIWERKDGSDRPLKGEDVIVAIIDTGIDWSHPAFGGYTEAPNAKVVYSVSYTGEPPKDNFGHGSHVAGIVAGDIDYKGTPRGDSLINGMAPKAKLMGYKVLSASGSGSATNIILAMEDAVKRGAHVINLSLGDLNGDPFSPESSAANNAMLAGCVVCAAAGNSGPTPDTIGAPGAAHHVITMR